MSDETYIGGLRDLLQDFLPRTLLILDEAHHAAQARAGAARQWRWGRRQYELQLGLGWTNGVLAKLVDSAVGGPNP